MVVNYIQGTKKNQHAFNAKINIIYSNQKKDVFQVNINHLLILLLIIVLHIIQKIIFVKYVKKVTF